MAKAYVRNTIVGNIAGLLIKGAFPSCVFSSTPGSADSGILVFESEIYVAINKAITPEAAATINATLNPMASIRNTPTTGA